MNTFKSWFISTCFFTFVVITLPIMFAIALIIKLCTWWFDKRLRLLHLFTCFWGSMYTYIMPAWKIKIEGREKFRDNVAYMVVCNHQSLLDILINFRLYKHFKFVSKIEIFRIPFIGWNMLLNRYIKLRRGDKQSVAQMMKDAGERLMEGSSVLFYPEGTRSETGEFRPFKPGAFILAKEKKVPILPIVVSGTKDALPKKSFDYHGVHKIWLRVLDEIPFETFANMKVEDLIEMVRNLMLEAYRQLDRERLMANA
ncbi:MAG: 1-acyl-sn-glycerol-3-phosphate acyltransferase [Spirochaetes bacterium]|nr:1-acyl-sn-glycerol-3-phosphate acyltransferase [Spirochaetota bacterium]